MHIVTPTWPSRFKLGDVVDVTGVEYPPGSGKVSPHIGLYEEPGYPVTHPSNPQKMQLRHRLCGTADNGSRCLIVAITWWPADDKWYYLLLGPTTLGWTRVGIRLKSMT